MTPTLLTLACLTAGAVALLSLGLRGRRVDDHPLCRRCGFDLTGRPTGSTRCAECGANLGETRSIRVGHRVRRRGMLASGGTLLLVGGTLFGLIGWSRAKGVDWNRHKPGWWLVIDAKAKDPATRDAALAELFRRIDAGTLRDADIARLVDHALAEQGDVAKPWSPVWGDAVERARAGGRLSDERWARFVRQTIGPEVVTLTVHSDGGPDAWVEVTPGTFRVGKRHQRLAARVWLPPPRTWPGPEPDWDTFKPLSIDFDTGVGWLRFTVVPADEIAPAGAGPGRHTARLPVRIEVFDVERATSDHGPTLRPAHAEQVIEATADWELPP